MGFAISHVLFYNTCRNLDVFWKDKMSEPGVVKPRITVLNQGQIEQVHEYSLKILASTGIQVVSKRAREIFAGAAGREAVKGDRVRIPRELVEWALKNAPAAIDVYNRSGDLAFCLGNDRPRFGIGVTNLYYQDPETDRVVPFTRKHMADSVRLGHALPHYDVVSTVGILQDISPEIADIYATLEMAANTVKPLVLLISEEKCYPVALDLLEHLHGDLSYRPFIIPYFNPITPLIMNAETTDKMFTTITRSLPFIYSTYSMAGMSTPITPAGTLALMNAELLAGLTLSQLIKESTPVILGILPAFFDMKTMVSFYDPNSILLNLACAEMMAFYHLPHCGISGSGSGWGPDILAGETLCMSHLTGCGGKMGLAPFVGGNFDSLAFSPTLVVYAHEVIGQSLRFAGGFQIDDESAGLKEIDQAGPGGNFLTSKQTARLFRGAYYHSPIFPRLTLEKWQGQGGPKAADLLRTYTRELMAGLDTPEDYSDTITRGEEFIKGRI